ncbi:hypothetical protein ACFSTH_14035 [Paenibacillus yanchengensis]|uniref:Uncharacterized protein n=1 Tax=Paenibacillus yanchengensis TaxID=2035833 RepID=A0ABW4YNV9_9BACL
MIQVTMNLVDDWVNTVKEVLKGTVGYVEEEATAQQLAYRYYQLSLPEAEAATETAHTLERLKNIEQTIKDNMDAIIIPDIRKRTNYEGNEFHFCWVYQQGEHIVEMNSQYRIPL